MIQVNQSLSNFRSHSHENRTDRDSKRRSENLAAILSEAVYPVALRHGDGTSWVDLELALWNVLTETLNGPEVAEFFATKGV
jgi:hypothetical protein